MQVFHAWDFTRSLSVCAFCLLPPRNELVSLFFYSTLNFDIISGWTSLSFRFSTVERNMLTCNFLLFLCRQFTCSLLFISYFLLFDLKPTIKFHVFGAIRFHWVFQLASNIVTVTGHGMEIKREREKMFTFFTCHLMRIRCVWRMLNWVTWIRRPFG